MNRSGTKREQTSDIIHLAEALEALRIEEQQEVRNVENRFTARREALLRRAREAHHPSSVPDSVPSATTAETPPPVRTDNRHLQVGDNVIIRNQVRLSNQRIITRASGRIIRITQHFFVIQVWNSATSSYEEHRRAASNLERAD